MLHKLLTFFFLFIFTSTFSQSYKVKIGTEVESKHKIDRINRVIKANENGCIVFESHLLYTNRTQRGYSLQRFDTQGQLQTSKEYDETLKDFVASTWNVIEDKLYLFEGKLNNKQKNYEVNLVILSLTDFSILLNTKQIGLSDWSYTKYAPKINFQVNTLANNTGFGIIVDKSEKNNCNLDAYKINTKGEQISTINIAYGTDMSKVAFVNAFFKDNELHIITEVRKTYEASKKRKNFDYLANYTMSIYDYKAKKIKDIEVFVKDKFLRVGKFYELTNSEYFFSTFYSNTNPAETNDGFSISTISTITGAVLNVSNKETTNKAFEKINKNNDPEKGSYYDMIFVDIIKNPKTGGFLVLTEEIDWPVFQNAETNNASFDLSKTTNASAAAYFIHAGIIVVEISPDMKISWLNRISKNQNEIHRSFGSMVLDRNNPAAQFKNRSIPNFTSFSVFPTSNNLVLVFNDHEDNASVTTYSPDQKEMDKLQDAKPFAVAVNYLTGKLKKTPISIGNDKEIMVPKSYGNYLNTQYLLSVDQRIFKKASLTVSVITAK